MKNVESAYPLSPMQQGMLFHSLLAETPGMYLEQIRATLEGELDVARLGEAWQQVVDRHSILRTAMVWDGLDEPLQVVRRQVRLPWAEHDLGTQDHETYLARLAEILQADRDLGFDPSRAPLMRCTVIRRPDQAHDLIWTYHHMILDGWCSSIIVNEVFTIYDALGRGTQPSLDEPRPYREYIGWLSNQDRDRAERFWREELRGITSPTALRLPGPAHSQPAENGPPGEHVEYVEHVVQVDSGLAAAARSLARSHRLTLSTVLQGAWAVVLAGYSGDDDVVLGATVSGRPPHLKGIETMLGLFVNTLPVRVHLDPSEPLLTWLERLQAGQLDREEHGFTPLVDIQSWVGLAPGTPLFETVVAFESYPVDQGALAAIDGLELTDSRVSMEETNYPLVLQVVPEPELVLRVLYDSRRFPHDAVVRLCRHLVTVLEHLVADPGQRLGEISLLTASELDQLLSDWARVVEAPSERCLHELFEASAAQRPEAPAVSFAGSHQSYGELDRRANQLAHHLVGLGVGPDVLVGLYLERSADLIVAVLAILKAGGAYLPLDPAHPRRRLALVLDDAEAPVIVTFSHLADDLPSTRAAVVSLDLEAETLAALPQHAPSVEVGPDNLAYVIYTSGSTGRPKGSLITHRNVTRLFTSTWSRFRFDEHDVWTLCHTIAFDFSVWEIWGALLYGGRVVVVPHAVCRSSEDLLDLLVAEQVTVLNQTPSAFRQLIDTEQERRTPPRLALRLVIFGGERLDLAALRPWFDRHGDEHPQLVNMYGITETTVHVTWRFLHRADLDAPGSLIGEPIPDLRVAILDSRRRPVPIGVPGELCIAGPGLSRGYLHQPELTQRKFPDSPFAEPAGERLFCSGDLARRLPDGDIEYLGRIDHQVKIRGFRIELGEIEEVLTQHPGVRESIVVARTVTTGAAQADEQPNHDTVLMAYAVPANDWGSEAAEPGPDPQLGDQVVRQWERVFEEHYRGAGPDRDAAFDITGWNSSYTGEPIPAEEMREWTERTVERILELEPRRVLEIGCGTGLLLGRVAPHCTTYVGTDLSRQALAAVEQLIATRPDLAHVHLRHQTAENFDNLLNLDSFNSLDTDGAAAFYSAAFDTVVLSSVVQYFPDVDYLVDVVHGALDRLEPGGALFIGDVRSRPLLEAFHASVELHRAPGSTTLGQLRQRVVQRAAEEEELVLDPELFAALGDRLQGIAEVTAQLRRGRFINEMTRFRYDVLIRKAGGTTTAPQPEVAWRDWDADRASLDDLRTELRSARPASVGLVAIPNARLGAEIELLHRLREDQHADTTLTSLRPALEAASHSAVDPEALWALGDELGYRVELTWSEGRPGCFDAVLSDRAAAGARPRLRLFPSSQPVAGDRPWRAWANDPLRRLRTHRLSDELREHLKERLPDYMVPAHITVLEALPLTANGKVDARALPEPETRRARDGDLRPRTAAEEILIGIWAEVLGLDRVGRNDDFFDLGGHSLMATQVISRVRSAFAVDVPMRQLFAEPTVAGFAAAVEARRTSDTAPSPPLLPTVPGDRPPLSFSQQRLWFLHQLEDGASATYNVPLAVELRGPLDLIALGTSLDRVVARHASLRTVFAVADSVPYQHITPPAPVPLDVVDLLDRPTASRAAEARQLARDHARQPFDLSSGPMLRATVYRKADEEHLLLLCMHHICSDGWSTGVLLSELGHLYGALSEGREPEPLPDLPVQYVDVALWQRRWLTGATLEQQLEHWRSSLTGYDELLRLPTDRPRPATLTFRGCSTGFRLDQDLTARLRRLGRRNGCTLYMTLLAAYGALLHRYSGADRVVVGTPVANRRQHETEHLIGFFVNTLALGLDCSGDPTFRSLLERVREVTLGAYDHQDLPFELLVEALQPTRDLSHTPIFQTMLVLQSATSEAPRLPGLGTRSITLDLGASKLDLTLSFEEGPDGLIGELQYSTDLFDAATARRIIAHYRTLLEGAVTRPATRLSQLPLLDDAERAQLAAWSTTRIADPEDRPLPFHAAFERRVAESPTRPAVISPDETLTYSELDRRANHLAEVLRTAGVGPETLVPVCLDRSPWWIVALLGVAKAGGAFVVLDPAYPDDRLTSTVADTGAPTVLTQEEHRHRFDSCGATIVTADATSDATTDGTTVRPGPEPSTPSMTLPPAAQAGDTSPDRAVYAIYTSGSTGRPKGVVVTHGSFSSLVHTQIELFDIRPGDRLLQLASPTFDVAIADLGMALAGGATLCVAPTEQLLPGPGLIDLMQRLGITHVATPPSALTAVSPDDLPDLKVVIIGGEPCSTELIERWSRGRRLFNSYGPTEATVCSTVAEHVHDGRALSIGRPFDYVSIHILDRHGQPVPIGVVGELYIGGRGVARGYLGRPGLTAERFVPDPFDRTGGARLYRTGDLARFLGDGTLELLGREDRQVKIRGYRIEPDEVEAVLREHPAVARAAVVVLGSAPESRRLVACIEPKESTSIDTDELRHHLGSRLPHFTMPSQLVVSSPLPLSVSGKIDHRAVERQLATMTDQPQPPSRPLTDDETHMARVWEEVLEHPSLDPDASFFDSGGHSLAAMRVIARVQETFNVDIPVRVLFEAPTLASFTRAVVERRDHQGADSPVLRRMPRQPVAKAEAAHRGSR